MITKYLLHFFCFFILSFSFAFAEDRLFLRYPSLNPQGDQVAFSYQGDIWTVSTSGGRAKRLTIHPAYDAQPRWNPDGNLLAFSSDRYGNQDIFVLPSAGGSPKRLTYHSAADEIGCWTSDNKLLFMTARTFSPRRSEKEIHQLSPDGGTPERFFNALGKYPALSPNGRFLAFVRGGCPTAREEYRGSSNGEIWIYDTETADYQKITDFAGNDFHPDWGDDNTLYYLSSVTGKNNLYRVRIDHRGASVGKPERLTHFTDFGVHAFDVSADGETIVFEKLGEFYRMQSSGKNYKKIAILIVVGNRYNPIFHKTFTRDISEYAISPDDRYCALVIHGEIVVKENDKEKKRCVNVSNHPFRDSQPVWLNESSILFVSDREGQRDLYLVQSEDEDRPHLFDSFKHRVTRLTETKEEEKNPTISPDGKQLIFTRGRNSLIIVDISEEGEIGNERVLLEGNWHMPKVVWSPDSQWIAYSLTDLNFNEEIYIQPVDGRHEPINVSMHPRNDFNPVWSPDGSKLGFVSDRKNFSQDAWFVWLKKSDWEKTKEDWSEEAEKSEADSGTSDKEKEKKSKIPEIQIDREDIHDRLVQVTTLSSDVRELAISQDGKTFFFTAENNTEQPNSLYSIQWDGEKIKEISKSKERRVRLRLNQEGKHLYFVQSGVLEKRAADDKGKIESLPHKVHLSIDRKKERTHVFEDAWRSVRDNFYDPQFHGKDWEKIRDKYKACALTASSERDFHYIFNLMLGRLNASHMRMWGRYGSEGSESERTGLLGLEVVSSEHGVLVKRVVPDSPADKAVSKINVGDIILSINEEPITKDKNFYALLTNKTDEKLLLAIRDAHGVVREVVIRPTGDLSTQLYKEWVKQRKKLVEKYSQGRLGYIHIRSMGISNIEKFERELMATGYGKEGIVIDVRFNGGGWTTDYLLTILNYKQHAYTIPRGATQNMNREQRKFENYYPYGERLPFPAWTKPTIAMCNEFSFSNAEIFSHAYKNLGLGKLVGRSTYGGVISTGSYSLLDGSFIRQPFRGWFTKKTHQNMEKVPAVPDCIIENAPDSQAKGEDPQLKKAVEELLREVTQRSS